MAESTLATQSMDSNYTLGAYTLMPEPNSTYLANTKYQPYHDPISGTTTGLMMMLSTLQYQAPYMNPMYSNAASQAGKAAYIESGGQSSQDRFQGFIGDKAKQEAYSLGVTKTEMVVVLGAAKIARDKSIDLQGPKIYFIQTHINADQDKGTLGLKWEF